MPAAQEQEPAEDPIGAVIAEAGGDTLEAIRMLLREIAASSWGAFRPADADRRSEEP